MTIVTDPLADTQIRGIPLQLKRVLVEVDRPNFEFNPTSCDPMEIEGTIYRRRRRQRRNVPAIPSRELPSLPFASAAHGERGWAWQQSGRHDVQGDGPLRRGRTNGVAQAGIAKVNLQLPKQLSSRLPTLQKACTEAAFNANPASCPEGSVIGYAHYPHPGPARTRCPDRRIWSRTATRRSRMWSSCCRAKGSSWSWTARPQIKRRDHLFEVRIAHPTRRSRSSKRSCPQDPTAPDAERGGIQALQPLRRNPRDADHHHRPERRGDRTETKIAIDGCGAVKSAKEAHPRAEARKSARRLPQALHAREDQAPTVRKARTQTLSTREQGEEGQARSHRAPPAVTVPRRLPVSRLLRLWSG